ncbi:hypothetical protein A2U01_0103710, partial [Trifolium medium]|nr:hypothetical protein [Trifolium medium]
LSPAQMQEKDTQESPVYCARRGEDQAGRNHEI